MKSRPLTGGAQPEPSPLSPFGDAFAAAFRQTQAFETWDAMTDPVIFDLSEPRHPCEGKVSAVSDMGIRLAEGLHDLRIEESLAPTREALSSAAAAASSSFFRTFDSVREGVNTRLEAERQRRAAAAAAAAAAPPTPSRENTPKPASTQPAPALATSPTSPLGVTLASVGSSFGSFFGSRFAKPAPPVTTPKGLRPMSLKPSPGSSRRGSASKSSTGSSPTKSSPIRTSPTKEGAV